LPPFQPRATPLVRKLNRCIPAPYSPDFNPIEQLFAKLKALLRKAAERSVEGLWNRIACLLDAFQPDECVNYFRNSGYAAC
jgi:transposase